ncbi:DNA repair exonuclease [Candidatus Micrarchaeota archaeon]|nr:DNA repair exonuclease [Candidatus Micrarchaeota archaeon]
MRIAIISDTHFGYARFEEDSYKQAENAVLDANIKADFIILAGDVFDTKIPKLETLKRAAEIFNQSKIPILAIHGNHERRSKGMINPVQLLASIGVIDYLHGMEKIIGKDGEKVYVLGVGSVPEDLASEALKKVLESRVIPPDHFKILVIHQSIKELSVGGEHELSLEELESTPFDLIINGHIHERIEKLGGRFIIPGSTVVTQLKREEARERGYIIYDTESRKNEFIVIPHRKFFYEEFVFTEDDAIFDIKGKVENRIVEIRSTEKEAIIKIKIKGKLKDGLKGSDLSLPNNDPLVFIDNNLTAQNIKERINQLRKIRDEKLSVREVAIRELELQLKGKITRFDPSELFEKLSQGVDEAEEYLNSLNKKG